MRSILRRPSAVYPRQEKTITSSRQQQIVVPDPGYYLSKVISEKYPDANGTYTAPARSGNNDMGATNNYRYVDTTGLGDTKSAIPSANAQEITPDAGRYLSKVIVDATPVQDVEITAGTSSKVVTPDNGKFFNSVTVNPTPSQTKTATPGPQSYGVLPDSGMLLSSVTVLATPTQAKTIAPDANQHIVKPDTGKFLSQVTVQAVASEEKTITASRSQQVVTPTTGKVLKKVIVNKYPDASGTYTCPANWNGSPATGGNGDMGATNNIRLVNATNVYNKGKADGRLASLSGFLQMNAIQVSGADKIDFAFAPPSRKFTLRVHLDTGVWLVGDTFRLVHSWSPYNYSDFKPADVITPGGGDPYTYATNVIYVEIMLSGESRGQYTKISYTFEFDYS